VIRLAFMRRFEFVDGTSRKFWEIDLHEKSFEVRWGRLGTDGQSQTKSFPSADKAKSTHDKLVAEKLGKGYSEIGASAATQSKSTPAPTKTKAAKTEAEPASAEETPFDGTPRIVWTDALRRRLYPFRGEAREMKLNRAKLFADMAAGHKKLKEKPRDAAEKRAEAELEKPKNPPEPDAMTLETELGRARLLRVPQRYNSGGNHARDVTPNAVVDWWVASKGLPFAVEALLACCSGQITDYSGNSRQYQLRHDIVPWPRLREHLAGADDETYAKARAIAEKTWKKTKGEEHTAIAFAFPAEPWGEERVSAAIEGGYGQWCIAATVTKQSTLRKIAKSSLSTGYQLYENGYPYMPTLLRSLGPDGWDAIAAMIDKAYNPAGKRFFSELLACVEREEVARFFAEHLGDPNIAGAAVPYFHKVPMLAAKVLKDAVEKDPKSPAKQILAAVQAEHGESKAKASAKPTKAASGPRMPAFFSAGTLPKPKRANGKGEASVDDVHSIGVALMNAPAEGSSDLEKIRSEYALVGLADLAWAIFESWMLVGAPNDEAWALRALGHLGDAETARRLTPLLRSWPGESAHARAVFGLDVLARIGSRNEVSRGTPDVALMHLHGVAQRIKFKGLQDKARAKIDEIAKARGLTPEELADRLVPDLSLDDDGSLTLDFGSRTFRVGFDEALKPFVKDAQGKRLDDLPKPGKSDDATKSAEAVDTWKTLKKDARAIASSQVLRLELAMCARRRWKAMDFQALLVDHPLLRHLVRRLVWGEFDSKGKLVRTFRVAEDGTFADVKDVALKLKDDATVGLVHTLDLDEGARRAWGAVLGDYELIQPFGQLGRPTFELEKSEAKSKELARFKGTKVSTSRVVRMVEARGWRRGPPQDSGGVWWMEKHLPNGIVAHLGIEPGIAAGDPSFFPEQTLHEISLEGRKVTFGDLDPVIFSELVADVHSLS